jgi:hypothetical protein
LNGFSSAVKVIGAAFPRTAAVYAIVPIFAITLQSCGMVRNISEGVYHPMTPEQSKAQVVDAAREIVGLLGLKVSSANFHRESCNDQGQPPFRGIVELDYDHAPTLEESQAEIQRMLAVLKRHGWSDQSDFHSHSPHVTKQGVTAIFDPYSPVQNWGGSVEIDGECRDMTTKRNTLPEPVPSEQLT